MEWQPIDFYGIISLDHHVADLLKQHLEEKEAHLADEILKLTSSDNFSDADQPPKASFAFESLTAYLKSNGHLEPDQKNLLINQLNEGFWDYTEVLKSCAVELFQQINQLDVDQWHSSMLDVVKQIKSLLQKHIEEFTWSLRRLESPLQTFMKPKNTGLLRKLWKNNFSSENLDFEIISHLAQSERFLQQQYNEFYERFQEYTHVKNEAELSQKKNA